MTPQQKEQLMQLAEAARPQPIFPEGSDERNGGDDWGGERQIEAENAFHVFVSAELGVDTDDMATAKAGTEEMINECLRRAEMAHLCGELNAYCTTHGLPHLSADELLNELYSAEPRNAAHCEWVNNFLGRWDGWLAWKPWHPYPT